jgi:hypothetical protein
MQWIIKETACGLDSTVKELGPVADFCEHGNERSGSIKCGILYEELRQDQLLRKESAS